MKVLIINGSPHESGNTAIALREAEKTLNQEGIETVFYDVGKMNIAGCIDCGHCRKNDGCVFGDIVNEISAQFKEADGLLVGTPVYYANTNATLMALMQRLFYSSRFPKAMKVGAAVAVARRSGTTASFDEMNKFFTISGMPVASSTYWNNVYGSEPGDARQDLEGLQTMRYLGKNMAFLIKSIALGKERYGLPAKEETREETDFIR